MRVFTPRWLDTMEDDQIPCSNMHYDEALTKMVAKFLKYLAFPAAVPFKILQLQYIFEQAKQSEAVLAAPSPRGWKPKWKWSEERHGRSASALNAHVIDGSRTGTDRKKISQAGGVYSNGSPDRGRGGGGGGTYRECYRETRRTA
ncbi:hypothetical protein JRQ81_015372 [Phrynocephalus forsythii]|uniref:Uncharacterized protein n=1 Tax=Phrynocephalus forsythii TaxID=171643 RepID=A0A9Q0XTS4_9SAUR|nr:hypothetical protein JRQ81_015372 [Phrynocephalus forsythii]